MKRTKAEASATLYTKWFGHPHFKIKRVAEGWQATSEITTDSRPVLTLMDGADRPVEVTHA